MILKSLHSQNKFITSKVMNFGNFFHSFHIKSFSLHVVNRMEPLEDEEVLISPEDVDLPDVLEAVEIPVDITWKIPGKKKSRAPQYRPKLVVSPILTDYQQNEDDENEGFVDYPDTPEEERELEESEEELFSPLPDEDPGEDSTLPGKFFKEEERYEFVKEDIKYTDVSEETRREILKTLKKKKYRGIPERLFKVVGIPQNQYNVPEKVYRLVKTKLRVRPVNIIFGYEGVVKGLQPKDIEELREKVAKAESKARAEGRDPVKARVEVLPGFGRPWPFPPPEKPIEKVGAIPERRPYKVVTPPAVKKTKIPLPPENYTGNIRWGDRVEFQIETPLETTKAKKVGNVYEVQAQGRYYYLKKGSFTRKKGKIRFIGITPIRGIVSGFQKQGFQIRGDNNKTYVVGYSHPLQKVKHTYQETPMSFYDFYALPVTQELRKTVVNYIFDLVSQLIPDLTRIKREEKSPIPEPPIKSWEEYYNEQFQAWNYARLYPTLIENITLKKCWNEAKNKVKFLSDPTLLLQGLTQRYGTDFFNPKGKLGGTVGSYMIKKLSDAKNPTILDVVILTQLRRSDPDSLEGTKLAEELNIAVQNYLRKYPPSEKKLYEACVRKTVYQQFLKYEKSKKNLQEDKKLFDIENLKKLKQLYEKYTSEREVETKEESIEKPSQEAEEYMKRVGKLNLTQKGVKVHQQITDFEVIIFALSDGGRTIFEYLRRALIPTIFLNKYGNIGKYCKFFQAKISTGAFELRALNDANLAHYFPELVMKYISRKRPADLNKDLAEFTDKIIAKLQEKGDIESLTNFVKRNIRHYFSENEELATALSEEIFGKSEASEIKEIIDSFFSEGVRSKLLGDRVNLSDKELAEATDQIASQLLYEMNQTLEAFVYAKRSEYGKVSIPKFHLKEFYWKGYTSKPQDICKKDTGTGYIKTKRLGPRKYREEPISNEQLVICYDPEVGFSCGTIRKIIENIVTGTGNPSTKKPYPEEFVAKMRERYPQVFKEEEELEEKVEKEMEEERLAIEKELSELEEWPKDIQRQYELLFGERFEEPKEEEISEEEEEEIPDEEEMSAKEIKTYKGPMLVFFTASWGEEGPDDEVWDEFKETYPEIRFVRVDIDEEQELADIYGVQSIPLFILFNKGKQVERFKKWKEEKVEKLLAEI